MFLWESLSELPWVEIDNSVGENHCEQVIPCNVYQTWENNLFGKTHAASILEFRGLNPHLNFFLYTAKERDLYMRKHYESTRIYEIYQKANFGQIKADIFRYCIIYERGGYYFDISKGMTLPLNTLHKPSSDFFLSNENTSSLVPPDPKIFSRVSHPTKLFAQYGFGFSAHHPILARVLSNIEAYSWLFEGKTFQDPARQIRIFTGPGMFIRSIHEEILSSNMNLIETAGLDFNGASIFSQPGSHMRYRQFAPYDLVTNSILF